MEMRLRYSRRKYRYHQSREIEGKIKTLTLKRTPLGEFFIAVVTDHVATGETENMNRTAIGIDFGMKTFLNLSNGEKIESPLFLKQSMLELKRAGRVSIPLKRKVQVIETKQGCTLCVCMKRFQTRDETGSGRVKSTTLLLLKIWISEECKECGEERF
jgi:transposase